MPLRRLLVEPFRYTIYVLERPEKPLYVLAVAHQHRRPGYWMGRLEGLKEPKRRRRRVRPRRRK